MQSPNCILCTVQPHRRPSTSILLLLEIDHSHLTSSHNHQYLSGTPTHKSNTTLLKPHMAQCSFHTLLWHKHLCRGTDPSLVLQPCPFPAACPQGARPGHPYQQNGCITRRGFSHSPGPVQHKQHSAHGAQHTSTAPAVTEPLIIGVAELFVQRIAMPCSHTPPASITSGPADRGSEPAGTLRPPPPAGRGRPSRHAPRRLSNRAPLSASSHWPPANAPARRPKARWEM